MTDEERIRQLLAGMVGTSVTPDEVCAEHPELLSEIRRRWKRMRCVEEQIDQLFPISQSEFAELQSHYSTDAAMPQIVGYEVQCILGRGGMGMVYRVRHLKLNRIVALKMMLAGQFATPQELARFVRESQAVAELQHSNIVQVHDVGDVDGIPYFTMEFVEGGTLAQDLAGVPQPSLRAAELVASISEAVQLAHTKRIIHRDLKPTNILLTNTGIPKIADFGLARHVDGDPKLTFSDARVGTPSYMAPEQALGRLGTIGTAVDIYSLGAILYEMLTGRPPFHAETALETQRQVVTVDALPPSRLNPNVPRDLETICLKCLRKDPSRRYSTALELADDLRRFLGSQPILARPVGRLERTWRWARRNPTVALLLSGVTLLLLLIFAGSVWAAAYFRKMEGAHRLLAREKGDLADQKSLLAAEMDLQRTKAVDSERRESGLRKKSEAQGKELRRNLYLTEMNLAGQASSVPSGLGVVRDLLATWEESRPDLRNWEWYYLNSLCHHGVATRLSHAQSVHYVAWDPSGRRAASASADRTICIWDPSNEQRPVRLFGHTQGVHSLAWSPDGKQIASASWDKTVRVWDTTLGKELCCFDGHTAEVYSVAWSPDGNQIASGGKDQTVRIWQADCETPHQVLHGHHACVASVSWDPNGKRLASGSHDSTIRLWDVAAGTTIRTLAGHRNWVNHLQWNSEGSRLASASNDESLRIWDPENGENLKTFRGHTQGVTSVSWSRDATRLASCSEDQTVKVWDVASSTELFSLRGHTAPLMTVAWNPKDDRIISGGHEAAMKVWDASSGAETLTLTEHDNPVQTLAWCRQDVKTLASADSSGVIKIWDIGQRTARWTLRGDQHHVHSVAWHPAGTRLATASGDGQIRIWNVATGKEQESLVAHQGAVLSVAWSPDGNRLASGGIDETTRIWDVTAGTVSREIKNHQGIVFTVTWSPDGKRLASGSADGTVRIWDLAKNEEVHCYRGHVSQVLTVAWSPDGIMLASAGFDQTVQIWRADTAQRTTMLRGHTAHVFQVNWSPDCKRLATAGRDSTVKVWDVETGKVAITLNNHTEDVCSVAWSPDGMTLASAGIDRRIFLHDATAGYFEARAPQILDVLDRRLKSNLDEHNDWRIRAEIAIRQHDWTNATANARRYLSLEPQLHWFMADCLIAGPCPYDLATSQPPEDPRNFESPAASEVESSASVHWRLAPYSFQGVVDFGPFTDQRDHVSAYALYRIYSPDNQRVAILLGSDDGARLWLNGERLYESLHSRAAIPDEDAIPAMLKAGWNALLVRVANENGHHSLHLRLSDSAVDLDRVNASAK